ncbi:hypothetical protein SDC9_184911 [bioreactor metagenome]|uniref:ATPase AAA-type core domain-containing protein n=1 Tax=bioreactor metagenome TaxID=1076179 RepID=A0A645HMQ6_9ZZZZ
MGLFSLEESKTPQELSEGMKVKYALTLALSHRARLLILDEPTSGLDPVSREDLLETFLQLKEERITILFSTHITSDLDKSADNIIYIRDGSILESGPLDEFVSGYKVIKAVEKPLGDQVIGCRKSRSGYSALIRTKDLPWKNGEVSDANLEDIMVHLE